MAERGVDVLFHTTLVGATRLENSRLAAVQIQGRRGRRMIAAKAFVDCSGDADLAFHCGASVRYGNHGTINLGSLATRFGGIPPDVKPTAALWREAIISAKQNNPSLRKVIRKNQSVLIRLPLSGDIVAFLASASYDATDSASITAAEISGRQQARKYLEILKTLPGHERMFLVSTGPNFGTRESRHVNAMYQITEEDIMSGRRFHDTIALGAWAIEFHGEHAQDWESTFKLPSHGPFEIPFRSLRSVDTPNLFVAGRCVDGDQYATSAIRVMGTALATGQAAGVAAGFVAVKGDDNKWSSNDVQSCLLHHGALLDARILPQVASMASRE